MRGGVKNDPKMKQCLNLLLLEVVLGLEVVLLRLEVVLHDSTRIKHCLNDFVAEVRRNLISLLQPVSLPT